ncbi:MAG: hypothetical protein SynsKO_42280 [Synoicihabitans sp.]
MPLTAKSLLSMDGAPEGILRFADSWIADKDCDERSDDVSEFEYSTLPAGSSDEWLQAIVVIAKKTEDGRHDALLAAGMLEDFLGQHGEEYFDTVAELARRWPRFRHLLGGVWKGRMKKGLWHRIEAIREQPW